MDDKRLTDAARKGLNAFDTEWRKQGGADDGILINKKFGTFKNAGGSSSGGSTNSSYSSGYSQGSSSVSSIGSSIGNIFQAQRENVRGAISGESPSVADLPEAISKMKFGLSGIRDAIRNILSQIPNQISIYFAQQTGLLEKMNTTAGMSGKISESFREEITKASEITAGLGISFNELTDSMTELVAGAGRFKLIDQETIERVALASKFTESMSETMRMMPNFQEVSMGVSDATKAIEKSGKSSLSLGLNARETVKIMSDKLDKLNQFGFKNGIDGLTRMIQKTQELRMSMDTVLGIADKVMDPEKALELSANLQVIGGSIGAFNDPIKMMYMATNDVEGLQDALAKSAESLVSFNQESGRFQIMGADLRRGKAMADALGISYKELANTAVQSAQRSSAAMELMSSGLVMSDSEKEFITNLAQMKGGKMVIEVPENLRAQMKMDLKQTEVSLDSLNKDQLKILNENQEDLKDKTMEQIAQQQVTLIGNIDRQIAMIAQTTRNVPGNAIKRVVKETGASEGTLKLLKENARPLQKNIREEGAQLTDEAFNISKDLTTTISSWFKNVTDMGVTAKNVIVNGTGLSSTSTSNAITPPANVANTTNNTETNTSHTITHIFKSDANIDGVRRYVEQLLPNLKEYYTSAFTPVKQ